MAMSGLKAGWQGVVLATALALLSACSMTEASDDLAGSADSSAEEGASKPSKLGDGGRDSGEAIPVGAEPVSSLPDREVYLYAGPDQKAILAIGDSRQSMDWTYSTVRGVLPALSIGDYDSDGEDELAAVLELGSGTGLLLDELHIVEFADSGGTSGRFTDHVFQSEDYLSQIRSALSFRKIDKEGKGGGRIAVGDRTYEVDLSEFEQNYGAEAIKDELGYGSIVHFQADHDKLAVRAAVGLRIDKVAEPQYIGSIEAAVRYADGAFKLEQYDFDADE